MAERWDALADRVLERIAFQEERTARYKRIILMLGLLFWLGFGSTWKPDQPNRYDTPTFECHFDDGSTFALYKVNLDPPRR